MNHPLNTILYGPPGTGKTYATLQRCVEICDQPRDGLTRERIRARYSELVGEGRVEFITFHQSYGYEEFVEGLRPETEGDGGGFRLAVRDGVIKRISQRARQIREINLEGRWFYKVSLGPVDGKIFKKCMEEGCVRFDWMSEHDWSDPCYDEWGPWSYPAFTDGWFLGLMVSDMVPFLPRHSSERGNVHRRRCEQPGEVRSASVAPALHRRFRPHG